MGAMVEKWMPTRYDKKMGRLEELQEGLYGTEEDRGIVGRKKRRFALTPLGRRVPSDWHREGGEDESSPRGSWLSFRMSLFFLIGGIVIFLIGAGAFVYFYLGADRKEAEITIGGRDFIEAGEAVTIPVTFRNTSQSALEDVQLAMSVPAGTLVKNDAGFALSGTPRIIEHIGKLAAGEVRTKEITVRFFGAEREGLNVEASLLYRPERLSARFSSSSSKRFTISAVPLGLFWEIPSRTDPRQKTEITLRYSSRSQVPFGDVWLRIDFPSGFTMESVTPKAAVGDSFWKLGTLGPGMEGQIVISGIFDGTGGEVKALRAGLGFFDERIKEWKPWREVTEEVTLSSSPFLLMTRINGKRDGVIDPGADVDVVVEYANRSAVTVRNVSIQVRIEGEVADLTSMTVASGGAFDALTGAVVWGPGGTEALRQVLPGQTGEVQMSVHTKKRLVMQSAADTNLTLRVRTSITAPDVPQELQGVKLSPDDTLESKVATIALFSGRAVFRASPIINSGPFPPQQGEKTTYVIIWEARNFTNAIENGELVARLPPNIRWESATYPSDADVSHNASTSEIRWRLGRLAAGAGVLAPARTAAFQISIVPAPSDVKKSPTLIHEANFSGKDMFTGQDVKARIDALTTELRDDTATTQKDWYVVE